LVEKYDGNLNLIVADKMMTHFIFRFTNLCSMAKSGEYEKNGILKQWI